MRHLRSTPVPSRFWLLALALPFGGCVLSPSPDLPTVGDGEDGAAPGASGGALGAGGVPASSGGAPHCGEAVPVEAWCAGDDLWLRSSRADCDAETWSVSPCPDGCVEAIGTAQASCRATLFGVGGLGGQAAGEP